MFSINEILGVAKGDVRGFLIDAAEKLYGSFSVSNFESQIF